jgi:hypothetical protein
MNPERIKLLWPTLTKEIGWTFPLILASASIKSKALFKSTKWGSSTPPTTPTPPTTTPDSPPASESAYLKQYAVSGALYKELTSKFGKDKAFDIMRKIVVPCGCLLVRNYMTQMGLKSKSGMDRIVYFNQYMNNTPANKHNVRETVCVNENVYHYAITRCCVLDFYKEIGMPELTQLICEVDNVTYPEGFPQFHFDRDGSWSNTMAYGHDKCHFRLTKKEG